MMTILIDLTVKSSVLLAAGTLIILMMRRASAASRHQVWVGVLCAIALLPVARLGLPTLNIAIFAPTFSPQLSRPSPMSVAEITTAPINPLANSSDTAALPPTPAPASRVLLSISDMVAALWLLGIGALAMRGLAGLVALRRLTARASAVVDLNALALLHQAADTFQIRRRIILLSHEDDGLPCTFGVIRPVILIPTSLLNSNDTRLRAVLVHETAHIARLDAMSERIAQVAVMLFWFNPIVWLAARQARFERERAADDAVLAGGAKASDYASDLLAIACTQTQPAWSSAVPMAVSGLERRVRAILDDRIRRGRHSRLSMAVTLILVAAMLPVSAVRLVARSAPAEARTQTDIPLPVLTSAFSPVSTAVQVSTPVQKADQTDPLATWNGERLSKLRQILRRARAAHQEALTKIQIGTTVPIDVTVLETTIARLEEAVKVFEPITTPMTPQEIKSHLARLSGVLGNLERTELRFTNGLATTDDVASALLRAASAIDPQIQMPARTTLRSPEHSSPFLFRPDTKPTPADATRARELYSFAGEVSFVHSTAAASDWQHVPGPGGFVYITGEVKNPGKYPLAGPTTVLQLLTVAGGLLTSADKNQIVIVSGTLKDKDGNPLTRSINYNDIMKGKNLKDNNVQLAAGDAVIVRSPGPGYYWQR